MIMSDFAGAGERTQEVLRQLPAHNDVIAADLRSAQPHLPIVRRRTAARAERRRAAGQGADRKVFERSAQASVGAASAVFGPPHDDQYR